jgi:RNA polymerase sigma factor (sigma-70 family)
VPRPPDLAPDAAAPAAPAAPSADAAGAAQDPLADVLARLARHAADPAAPGPDDVAWGQLIRALWPFAFAAAYRVTGGRRDLAEEATADAFVRLAAGARFDVLRAPAVFRAYLRVISVNAARDLLRRELTREVREVGPDGVLSPAEGPDAPPDVPGRGRPSAAGGFTARQSTAASAEEQVAADDLLRALEAGLSPEDRRLIGLLVEGYSVPEIAGRSDRSYDATAKQVQRLRLRVRRLLARLGWEDAAGV